jgi:hypothetical protein
MAFPENVVQQAWQRAGGKCECRRTTHGHTGRCNKQLAWENRGREGRGKWEAHHRVRGGDDTLSNCEILCWDCHSKTF